MELPLASITGVVVQFFDLHLWGDQQGGQPWPTAKFWYGQPAESR